MNKGQLYDRGQRNIVDGVFIRDRVMPLALSNRRWNIVVFEAYRVIELLIKGMMCLSGYTPKETHELDNLVDGFDAILQDARKNLPFTYTVFGAKGNCYGVTFREDAFELFCQIGDTLTQLGRLPFRKLRVDELLHLKLELSNMTLILYVDDQEIMRQTNSTIPSSTRFERGFVRYPDSARLDDLKNVVRLLRKHRESAFYSTHEFLEEDAYSAISLMEKAYEASKVFLVVDHK